MREVGQCDPMTKNRRQIGDLPFGGGRGSRDLEYLPKGE